MDKTIMAKMENLFILCVYLVIINLNNDNRDELWAAFLLKNLGYLISKKYHILGPMLGMLFKIFSPKNLVKILAFFAKTTACS
jgi:hypothetical protein